MATTRLEVRRYVGDVTGDMMLVVADDNAVDNTSIKDTLNLGGIRNGSPSLLQRQGIVSGGTPDNLGKRIRVTGNSMAEAKMTFAPALPVPVKAGDEIELWRERMQFGGIDSMHRLINMAIRFAENTAGPEDYMDQALFDRSSPYIVLPSTWAEFGGIEVLRNGSWRELPEAAISIVESTRTVQVLGSPLQNYNQHQMRAYGFLRALPVNDDVTPILCDQQWLMEAVSSTMTLAITRRLSDAQGANQRAGFWTGQANVHFPRVMLQRRGLGIRLP